VKKNTLRIIGYGLLLNLLVLQQSCSNTSANTSTILDGNSKFSNRPYPIIRKVFFFTLKCPLADVCILLIFIK
ncbi:MAG: hypothetical protein AAFR83_27325, partial [Cyanobacteria bacterium J06629_18]